mmetsp:Transcript_19472/g.39690  ORF Transcript_19472/g.39690 Transcript_19472/m.39690 type:complete len:205 (-) Transcript_19472:368-982(-)|eukprot:CAMPEP_0119067492 /NCGR_PEP_ID=MMETSP1178-20130426/9863_1 /TAXON_ID=33656 /ORGANISM="unid sp, Strain CCMP2000" /LENGTH=204 /DNA_ID=CAMNT_0007049151 /DNA_START=313 /DNA_END=927 /DNA_ORIENTATION=-
MLTENRQVARAHNLDLGSRDRMDPWLDNLPHHLESKRRVDDDDLEHRLRIVPRKHVVAILQEAVHARIGMGPPKPQQVDHLHGLVQPSLPLETVGMCVGAQALAGIALMEHESFFVEGGQQLGGRARAEPVKNHWVAMAVEAYWARLHKALKLLSLGRHALRLRGEHVSLHVLAPAEALVEVGEAGSRPLWVVRVPSHEAHEQV